MSTSKNENTTTNNEDDMEIVTAIEATENSEGGNGNDNGNDNVIGNDNEEKGERDIIAPSPFELISASTDDSISCWLL